MEKWQEEVSMNLPTKTVTISEKQIKISVSFTKYEKGALQGFATINFLDMSDKVTSFFNNLSVVKNKEGKLFLKEASKNTKNEDGTWTEHKVYLLEKSIKDIALELLEPIVK